MRPVLMVAYYFPPAGGAGVQRTLKFARYLPRHGWRPHVLVPDEPDYPVQDPSLEREIPPEVHVHRTRIFEPYGAYRRLTGRRGAGSLDVATLSRDARESARFSERLAECVRSTFFIPDARIGWLPFAIRAGVKVAATAQPAAIYSTAPPYTCHLIGRRLHQRTGLPWVADFRDSWVDWLSAAKRRGPSRRLDVRLEGGVLRDATRVITVSDGVAEDLASRHPGVRDDRWVILPNGFDPEDLQGVDPDRGGIGSDELLMSYSGTMYGPRSPETLVRAFESLARSGHPCLASWRVRLIGRVADAIRRRIEDSGVSSVFTFADYVPHRRAIALAGGSDVLLLIVDDTPQSRGILTGKLFEYLGLGKPILALAPDGEATELIARCDAGWQVRPGDTEGMARRLVTIWEAWRTDRLHGPTAESVARYRRESQAAELARILDDITA